MVGVRMSFLLVGLFVVFVMNVLAGSLWQAPFFNEVTEMLVLLGVAVVFVAMVLKSEQVKQDREG